MVYYEQLQRGLALPNQGSSSGSGQQNTTIGAYGLKVKNAEADTAKSNEKLQGYESKSSNGSSSTSTTTQRGGSSGDTKVKALQVAVKKKSGSQGNSGDQGTEQVELESNDLANAPIKRGSNPASPTQGSRLRHHPIQFGIWSIRHPHPLKAVACDRANSQGPPQMIRLDPHSVRCALCL